VEKSLRLLIVIPVATAVMLITPNTSLVLTPLNVLAFAASVAGAWLLCFMSDYLVGMLAFWTTQTSGFIQAFYGIRLVLSGMIAPLAMFPPAMQEVLQWLPFPYMLNFSVAIAMGRVQGQEMLLGFVVQFAWAAIVTIAVWLVWKRAIRSYSAVGA
jgi:ABC-2 type transport system permease protein